MSILKSVRAGKFSKYTLFPNTKEELKAIIEVEIQKNGELCSLNHIDTSEITDMSELFSYNAFSGDISEWNVSNVKNMSKMFYDSSFNQDISNWNVSEVKDMSKMFSYSSFNQDISKWNVENVKYMDFMFFGNLKFNQDISKWNVKHVVDMQKMFGYTIFNQDISGWDIRNVQDMSYMFINSKMNCDLSHWAVDTRKTNILNIFKGTLIKNEYKPTLIFKN